MKFLLEIKSPDSALERTKTIAQKEGLSPKTEFHITIIGRETEDAIFEKLDTVSTKVKDEIKEDINVLLKKYTWSHTLLDEYFLITKQYRDGEERRSIIQTIELTELADFYSKLNSILNTLFLTPFPHITLYTTSTRPDKKLRGIGLYSNDQFLSLNPQKIIPEQFAV